VFSCDASGLYQVGPAETTAHLLTTASHDQRDQSHAWPSVLPGGRAVLFTRRALNIPDDVTVVRDLAGGETRVVATSQATYSAGFLVFPRGDTLYAQPFDATALATKGQPRSLGVPVYRYGGARFASFTANNAGTLLVLNGAPSARTQFAWFDRQGRQGANVGPEGEYGAFDITTNGDRVVANGSLSTAPSLWVFDATRSTPARLTFGDQTDVDPNVTADGSVFFVRRGGTAPGLYRININGGAEQQLRDTTVFSPDDVSEDARRFAYRKGATAAEAWAAPVAGGADEQIVRANAVVDQMHLSPDGRWVAYNAATEGGRQEVYVVPHPLTNARWLVSAAGGAQPIWRADGRELFYLGLDGILYSVAIETEGDVLKPGSPHALFKAPIRGVPVPNVEQYRAAADGQRFLFKVPVGEETQPSLRVILNWPGLLEQQDSAK
jgi:hypothetical protein